MKLKQNSISLSGLLVAFFALSPAMATATNAIHGLQPGFSTALADSHDLRLPDWGPYTKSYAGISHIPVMQEGARFDISVMPGIKGQDITLPSVKKRSGYHPWEFSPELSYYSYRYELQWKDQIFADASFARISDSSRLIRTKFVNRTPDECQPVLHLMASLLTPKELLRVHLPENGVWVNGVPYHQLTLSSGKPNHRDSLMYDGKLRGDTRSSDMVLGHGLGNGFGKADNDMVIYSINVPEKMEADLIFRHKNKAPVTIALFGAANGQHTLKQSEAFSLTRITAGTLPEGANQLVIRASGGALLLDGFAFVPANSAPPTFTKADWNKTPTVKEGPSPASYILQYPGTEHVYGLVLKTPASQRISIKGKDIGAAIKQAATNGQMRVYQGDNKAHYEDFVIQPGKLAAHSEATVDAFVCQGTREEVNKELAVFQKQSDDIEKAYQTAYGQRIKLETNPAGEPYRFSQERMAATLLGNCCYPIYTQGRYIRHYQPGKQWLSLYTWDAGFAGIGLINVDINRSLETLNAYTTPVGSESAFIHHGTPLPVQIYQYLEMWNASQSDELLSHYYPRLKQYYEFLLGRHGSSNTRSEKTLNLIRTWDYFYNSGGWDDYPPQKLIHKKKMTNYAVPVVSSSHAIRAAKILRMVADQLGRSDDIAIFDQDIQELQDTLQKESWDEASGYYGYLVVKEGQAEILRTAEGVNHNMGLGGVSPLVAGIANEKQVQAMMAHIKSPKELWTPVGLSTVDQSAPYYSSKGYWNGAVWMPHQWFLWKSMFDLGEAETAYKISKTALNSWKRSVDETYDCKELFRIDSGKGAGWHQFGALSGPITLWYAAHFKPGTVTTGYDTWIKKKDVFEDRITVSLQFYEPYNRNIIWICAKEAKAYEVTLDGKAYPFTILHPGLIQLAITNKNRSIIIVRNKQ